LMTKDFLLRWRPNTTERQQVTFGRWVTAAMAFLGVLTAPLVGHSVTIWFYLQQISAYLSVPLGAAIFLGLLWKRATTTGAITSAAVGFASGLVCFLDQTLNWNLPVLAHPYLNSFLHRSLLCWIITILVMVVVSLATPAPKPESVRGLIFVGPTGPWKGLADYRLWTVTAILATSAVWWIFR
jgi:SSS family solute:Na+ symporter